MRKESQAGKGWVLFQGFHIPPPFFSLSLFFLLTCPHYFFLSEFSKSFLLITSLLYLLVVLPTMNTKSCDSLSREQVLALLIKDTVECLASIHLCIFVVIWWGSICVKVQGLTPVWVHRNPVLLEVLWDSMWNLGSNLSQLHASTYLALCIISLAPSLYFYHFLW